MHLESKTDALFWKISTGVGQDLNGILCADFLVSAILEKTSCASQDFKLVKHTSVMGWKVRQWCSTGLLWKASLPQPKLTVCKHLLPIHSGVCGLCVFAHSTGVVAALFKESQLGVVDLPSTHMLPATEQHSAFHLKLLLAVTRQCSSKPYHSLIPFGKGII